MAYSLSGIQTVGSTKEYEFSHKDQCKQKQRGLTHTTYSWNSAKELC